MVIISVFFSNLLCDVFHATVHTTLCLLKKKQRNNKVIYFVSRVVNRTYNAHLNAVY